MVEREIAETSASGPASAAGSAAPVRPAAVQGTLVLPNLERQLRPGEVSLDELERAFRETVTEVAPAPAPAQHAAPAPAATPPPEPAPHAAAPQEAKPASPKLAARPIAVLELQEVE